MSDTSTSPFDPPEQLEPTVEEPVERPSLADIVDPTSIVQSSDPDVQDEQEAALASIEAPEGAEQPEPDDEPEPEDPEPEV